MDDQLRNQTLDQLLQTHLRITPDGVTTEKALYDVHQIKDIMEMAYDAGLQRGISHHPRYTQIDIEGRQEHYASLMHKADTQWINVLVLTPNIEHETSVPIDNLDEQFAAAKNLYYQLEGHHGSTEQIDSYYQTFRQLSQNIQINNREF